MYQVIPQWVTTIQTLSRQLHGTTVGGEARSYALQCKVICFGPWEKATFSHMISQKKHHRCINRVSFRCHSRADRLFSYSVF